MNEELVRVINRYLNDDSDLVSYNIGVIGEYGAGKSTTIDRAKKSLDDKCEIFDISLLSSISKKQKTEKSEVDILNSIYSLIRYNLMDIRKNSNMYNISVEKEKSTQYYMKYLFIGLAFLLCYILVSIFDQSTIVKDTNNFKSILSGLIKLLFIFPSVFYTLYGLRGLSKLDVFRIRKLSNDIASVELKYNNNNDNIENERQFIEGIAYMIATHAEINGKEKYIFIFEDFDRVSSILTIEFLRELNVRLNLILSNQNIKVIFINAIRIALMEKSSEKGVNTRAITKYEKYFDNTIYVKPIIKSIEKQFISDVKLYIEVEIEEENSILSQIKVDSNLENIFNNEFKSILEIYKETNIELYLDMRVYKSFLRTLYYNFNIDLTGKEDIEKSAIINEYFEANLLLFHSKYAPDIFEMFIEYLENDSRYEKRFNISSNDALKLVKFFERKLDSRYLVNLRSNNSEDNYYHWDYKQILGIKEKEMYIAFISHCYSQNKKGKKSIFNKEIMNSILLVEIEERYIKIPTSVQSKRLEVNFEKLINKNFGIESINEEGNNLLLEYISDRPNFKLAESLRRFFEKLDTGTYSYDAQKYNISAIYQKWLEIMIDEERYANDDFRNLCSIIKKVDENILIEIFIKGKSYAVTSQLIYDNVIFNILPDKPFNVNEQSLNKIKEKASSILFQKLKAVEDPYKIFNIDYEKNPLLKDRLPKEKFVKFINEKTEINLKEIAVELGINLTEEEGLFKSMPSTSQITKAYKLYSKSKQ